MAKRVDPADGGSYTQAEFKAQYGGLDEWNAAAPKDSGDVAKVKALQKENPGFKARWKAWCYENVDGQRCDPALLDAAALRRALRECQQSGGGGRAAGRGRGGAPEKRVDPADGGSYTRAEFIECYGGTKEWDRAGGGRSRGGGRGGGGARSVPYQARNDRTLESLAESIKKRQRTDADFKEKWSTFCATHKDQGETFADPTRHSMGFIKRALADIEGEAATVLAATVKDKQRTDADFKEKWVAFCDRECEGTKDPVRLTEPQLRAGLKECAASSLGSLNQVVRLASQVKEKQKADKEWAKSWKSWCFTNNEGTCDPSRFTPEMLKQALKELA